ncbi:MAG: trigger factor [Erysipelothrix sp.]|jgi:trigger factor|nr:trigger factor [Erysipelothrix sp.]
MKSTWQLNEKSTGVLKVTLNEAFWKETQEKALHKLAKNVQIDGFRKGSAPLAMVKKQIGEGAIFNEAIDMVANEAYQFGVNEHDLKPVAQASLDVSALTADSITLDFTIPVEPTVTLSDYQSVRVKKEAATVTDDELNQELETIQNRYAELVISDEPAALGDTVVIDFEGFKDEIPFEGGKGENFPLELGSNSFIEGFETQLVGAIKDQDLDVNVTFPEDYGVATLAGQPALFKVKVHEVKKRVLPEIDEEFIKDLAIEKVTNVEELKDYVLNDLTTKKEKAVEEQFEEELLNLVVEPSEVEIPDAMIEEETYHMFEDFKQRLEQQNYTLDLYMQLSGQDEPYLKEQIAVDAEKKIKLRLVLEAIAAEQNFEATDEQLDAEYDLISKNYGIDLEQVKQIIHKEVVLKEWRLKSAIDYLKENAQQ